MIAIRTAFILGLTVAGCFCQSRSSAVATIDGEPVTRAEAVRFLVGRNHDTVTSTLVLEAILDLELGKAGLEITEQEVATEFLVISSRIAPGRSSGELASLGIDPTEVRRQARLSEGWNKLFDATRKPLPDGAIDCGFGLPRKQGYIAERMEGYDIRKDRVGLPSGIVAEIGAKDGSAARTIFEDQAVAFVTGLVKPRPLADELSELVDSKLVDRELRSARKTVGVEEIEAWARSMEDKFKPPFDWRMICQFRQTTRDHERERRRRIQAFKRVTGWEPGPEEVDAFIAENFDYFSGQQRKVSHILIKTQDPDTGRELAPESRAAAKARIEDLRQEIEDGAEFGALTERFSEDPTTAKAKGVINAPVKKLGNGLDPAFRAAALKLQPGEVSPPVKTREGWHLIKCDELVAGTMGPKDFAKPDVRGWIVDELETARMSAWISSLRAKSRIWMAPVEDLVRIVKGN